MIDVDNIVSAYINGIGSIPASTIIGQELLQLKFKTIVLFTQSQGTEIAFYVSYRRFLIL